MTEQPWADWPEILDAIPIARYRCGTCGGTGLSENDTCADCHGTGIDNHGA
ncbi:hypothetical protein OUY22_02515 [Nonomuraea sp. MCN248]|uniref:Small CPxCG-related zinc finger protein n=1 Tax=Nonomuraea corallina TaxID=2989783 RepID=A0ABT4S5Q5_9ACTN|nr:hypothetical protein [Nonomuraea corallina]MDA0632276.1 hypothetical protein [Nonomuraea corallina]